MPTVRTREESRANQVKAVEMRKQGLSYDQISAALGVASGSVSYYLKKGGLVGSVFKPSRPKKHKTTLKHRSNGVVSVLGGAKDTDDSHEATGFAAGFISSWLGNYAKERGLDAYGLTIDVVNILRKGVK